MPEPPDFDQIARTLVAQSAIADDTAFASTPSFEERIVRAVAEQLRLIWNARGAADLAKLEAELSQMMGSTAAGPYLKNLDRALRALDR